ncbi:MAG: hypothetical protein NTY19_30380 [Planctomycetota bacterium]|nr:hypothetical protein [Planctomycetota bacterium]
MDLIRVPRTLRDWLEAAVQEKYGLPRNSLLVNASHTHCGAESRPGGGSSPLARVATPGPLKAGQPVSVWTTIADTLVDGSWRDEPSIPDREVLGGTTSDGSSACVTSLWCPSAGDS